jgi:hypothetical protein
LPEIWAVGEDGSEVSVVLKGTQTELRLEVLDLLLGPVGQDTVDVVDGGSYVGRAVLRHALLDGVEVLPEVVDGLDGGAGGVVGPESARVEGLHPRRYRTRVRTTGEDPWGLGGIAAVVRVEWKVESLCDVHEIEEGVVEGQVLQSLGIELVVRRGVAPVSVCPAVRMRSQRQLIQ